MANVPFGEGDRVIIIGRFSSVIPYGTRGVVSNNSAIYPNRNVHVTCQLANGDVHDYYWNVSDLKLDPLYQSSVMKAILGKT